MKGRSESANKSKGSGSSRRLPRSTKSGDASGNYDCPREQMIAEAAYFRAERRGFAPGNEMSDWLEAESAIEGVSRSQ